MKIAIGTTRVPKVEGIKDGIKDGINQYSSKLEKMLYEDGLELGPIMGELSGNTYIRSENGSMGAWSNDMLTRKAEFMSAFQAAISPFFNDYYKM